MIETMQEKDKTKDVQNTLRRYVEAAFPSLDKVQAILMGSPLLFYLGIDPTGPDIHLGHTTNLILLKKLREWGHRVILLIGDFTARVGDPTGKDTTRKPLSAEEVKVNMRTYLKQVWKILPAGSFEIKYNSRWLGKLKLEDLVGLASHITVQQMMARDMFQRRIKEEKPISLHEFLYPLMQGYDSVIMAVDGEVGGNDQTFNMLVGRDLAQKLLKKEKIVLATKLLEDPRTGKKLMNKSEGQYISPNDSAEAMFGKVMAMPDEAIIPLLRYTTTVEEEKVQKAVERLKQGENPKTVKMDTALALVEMYYGAGKANQAKKEFENIFSKKELPAAMPEFSLGANPRSIVDFLAGWLKISKTEAKNLIDQKAVQVNDEVVADWSAPVKAGDVIRSGPRRFIKTVK